MEAKDVHVFGSPGSSESGQPVVTNMAMNMNFENSGGVSVGEGGTMTSPVGSGGRGQGSFDLFGKKKRGRPRKYDSDGKPRVTTPSSSQQGFSLSPITPSAFSPNRGRGRPPGSSNWKLLASLGDFCF